MYKKKNLKKSTYKNHKIKGRQLSLNKYHSSRDSFMEVFFVSCKRNIFIYIFLLIVDVMMVVFMARNNVVHLVRLNGNQIILGGTKYLLFGRNYVNLIIISFFSMYIICLQRFIFKKRITWKYITFVVLFYFLFNVLLFYCFTKRVY